MLYELEANWIQLEKWFVRYVARIDSTLVPLLTEWLESIRTLPITEKTLYLAELSESLLSQLATQDEREEWQELKKGFMADNKLKEISVIQLFENTIDTWAYISREKG